MSACVHARAHVCDRVCARACVRAHVCVCVCVFSIVPCCSDCGAIHNGLRRAQVLVDLPMLIDRCDKQTWCGYLEEHLALGDHDGEKITTGDETVCPVSSSVPSCVSLCTAQTFKYQTFIRFAEPLTHSRSPPPDLHSATRAARNAASLGMTRVAQVSCKFTSHGSRRLTRTGDGLEGAYTSPSSVLLTSSLPIPTAPAIHM
jgi:hypothetical protein